jgi:hypothetical protein
MNVAVKVQEITVDGPHDIACGISDDFNEI